MSEIPANKGAAAAAGSSSAEEALIAARRAKADKIRARGELPFANDVVPRAGGTTVDIADLRARTATVRGEDGRYAEDRVKDATKGTLFHVRGRVVAFRSAGGLSFLKLRDRTGEIQLLISEAAIGEAYARLEEIDLGDIVEAEGMLTASKRGELSIEPSRVRVVTKALRPPPEKWHGLQDVETRYRQRYVDLVANPHVADVFRARSHIVRALRKVFDDSGFLEVETPTMHTLIGGAIARPFTTHHNALDMQLFMRIAPELYLKRLLVGGLDRVYEIGRCYRNEGISTRHNPEFTMLEYYWAYATYEDLMTFTEAMLRKVDAELARAMPEAHVRWAAERPFALDEPFARIPLADAVANAARATKIAAWEEAGQNGGGAGLIALLSKEDFGGNMKEWSKTSPRAKAVDWGNFRKGWLKCDNDGERIFAAYEYLAEPFLTQDYLAKDGKRTLPVFIMDYPFETSPLARRNDTRPELVDRFELFVHGRELCNAFSELNDPDDQAERFRDQVAKKAAGAEETMDYDEDYIRALEHGMPPAAGFGMGIDRLVMMLTCAPSIRDVILFPLLRKETAGSMDPESAGAEAKHQFDVGELGELVVKNDGTRRKGRWTTEDVDQPWSIGEAIGVAMRAIRGHFASLVLPALGVILLGSALTAAPAGVLVYLYGLNKVLGVPEPRSLGAPRSPPIPMSHMAGASAATAVLALVFGSLAFSLLVEAALAAVRDVPVAPARFGRALRRTPRIVGWLLLFTLSVLVLPGLVSGIPMALAAARHDEATHGVWELAGMLPALFVAVGYILAFAWTPFFFVDDDASLIGAMRRSWRASKQYLGNTFLYLVALAPIALLALFPLVGIVPLGFVWLGIAYGYVRATGRNELAWYSAEFASRSIRGFLQVTLVALSIVAGILVGWVIKGLPTMHATAWSIQDTAIRAAAIVSSVAVIVVMLALLLPYMLDRLEGRRFTSFVAARHVRSQKSGFLTVISVLSICGVAISSCALSSVVSVMGGFSQDLKRKILGNNAHIVIDTTAGTTWGGYDATLASVRKVHGVVGATPVVHGEVMASSASNLAGVIVKGIDPESINDVIELERNIEVGKFDYLVHPSILRNLPPTEVIGIGPGGEQYMKGSELPALSEDIDPDVRAVLVTKPERPGIILGRELAKTLHVYVGDEITLVSPLGDLGPMGVMPRTKRFRVAAIFYSGMYEYDAMSVYTMLDEAMDYFQTTGKISQIDVKVDDAENADRITPAVDAAVARPELRIRDWREINKNLFSALKLERFATFIILSIAIMVASFCIVCTLLLMVTEKGKEIAILKAIGASDGSILRTFMIEGIIIGGIGTVFGVVTGLAMCTGLKWFGLRLDPEVYYIDRLPISVNGWDFLTVAAAAFTICTLSTVYPAYAASRLRPVDGLRYE